MRHMGYVIGAIIVAGWLVMTHAMQAHAAAEESRIVAPDKQWIVYYANEAKAREFNSYDIIVFDRDKHPSLQDLKGRNRVILGYVSAGEIETYRTDFEQVKQANALLEENPNWPGHFAVDVRNPEWTRYIIEDVIPSILQKGFKGIFLDTLDSVEAMELQQPEKYAGMIEASANMIKMIRQHYPNIKIMVNRGFHVMPQVVHEVDYVLAEGILVNYDFDDGEHTLFPDHVYEEYAAKMLALKQKAPHLQLLALDYWHMDDTEMVKTIYEKHEANGFLPYVTTIELNQVDPRP